MSVINELNQLLSKESSPVGVEDRKACVEFTLASLIASRLPIPSGPVTSVAEFYSINCKPVVEAKICPFNESYPINMIDVQSSIYTLWRRRYDFVHPIGGFTTLRLYSVLPAELTEALPPAHVKMASHDACYDIVGVISLTLEGK